jgi:uncharacterized LabA/DUF88 family protein
LEFLRSPVNLRTIVVTGGIDPATALCSMDRMVNTIENASTSARHIALLIDADNISYAKLPLILAELAKYGTANIRRAYGDWTAPTLKGWTGQLHEYAIRPIQQFNYSAGKNAADMALVIDALELLYTQSLAAFCIASSDADFTPLVMHLRSAGHDVYGFGERKTPKPFVNACTTFLYLEALGDNELSGEPAKAQTRPEAAGAKPASAAKTGKPLAQDTKLVTTLRGALDATVRDDGWALLAAAGSAAKRLAPIDPRNYGVPNFTKLFETIGLFEVQRGKNGQPYVADLRNKDRAAKPGE